MKLTLDWNCVIAVEEKRPQSPYITKLINCHRKGHFEVALLAASASENSKSKRFPGNAAIFKQRVAALGWDDLPLVKMPGILGLSYWDFCYIVDNREKFEFDKAALWQAIAPTIAQNPSDHLPPEAVVTDDTIQSEALHKWRNTWCDVISAYSHIHEGRDIFVTNNTKDFQRNAEKLSKLGMKHICTPEETLSEVAKMRAANR